ncbi:MAG: DUF721 domain-containing protein [Desulfovibrio sp.]|nr:DUF721 domain-containing protein [Desulfovibrio sp.]
MVKTAFSRRSSRRRRRWRDFSKEPPEAVSLADGIDAVLRGLGANEEQMRLLHLWECWPYVLGEALAPVALPLGHRNATLLVGCEDNMLLQELRFQQSEILDRVNAFMGEPFFTDMKVSLLLGKSGLQGRAPRPPENRNTATAPAVPEATGRYLADMDPASPVARCYALFAAARRP